MNAHAFISYQTADRFVAGKLKNILETIGIDSFLAHEDIEVSKEWQASILKEMAKANIFICILSKDYFKSVWCAQESGIAAFRDDLTIIPLSIDGTIPQGFFANIQSTKVDPEQILIETLLPGLVKHDFKQATDEIIKLIGGSRSFRGAEHNFKLILPYQDKLNDDQIKTLLKLSDENGQIWCAALMCGGISTTIN